MAQSVEGFRVAGKELSPNRVSERSLIVMLFVVALAMRLALVYYGSVHGVLQFNLYIENFGDFAGTYLSWLKALSAGLMPYSGFFYQYTPLFLYLLYPFYVIGGYTGAALPIVLADAGASVIIYAIVARVSGSRRAALAAGLAYAFSPLALLYEGLLLFSVEPMLLFVLLAVYLLYEERPVYSVACLAIAVLLRQEAIFLLPIYLLSYRKYGIGTYVKMATVFAGLLLLVSAPFLLTAPAQYLSDVMYLSCRCDIYSIWLPFLPQIDAAVPWLVPLLAAMVAFVLYGERRKKNFAVIFGAFLFAVFVAAFGYTHPHTLFRYYYLPAYALLVAASRKWQMSATLFCAMALSIILPPGPVQELLPFASILALVAIDAVYPTTGRRK